MQGRGVRSGCRSRRYRSLPLRDLPQDSRVGLFIRQQRAADKFRWTRGKELLSSYESSSGKFRLFCSRCGSHIVAERTNRDTVLLRLGCLDTPILERPKLHMWRSESASWFDPKDQLPEFPEAPPQN